MKRLLLLVMLLVLPMAAKAAAYNLSTLLNSNAYRSIPCSGSWSRSGSVYTCTGTISLASGDTINALGNSTVIANGGFSLINNSIGSSLATINLQSTYGTITSQASTVVYGNVTSSTGAVNLGGATINGSVSSGGTVSLTSSTINGNVSGNNGVTTSNSNVTGTLTSSSGAISLSGGTISGKVTTSCCTLTTNNTNMLGGAQAQSGMTVSGGTLTGAFVMSSSNNASFTGVTLTSGSISGDSTLTIKNSTLGSANSTVTVNSTAGAITLEGSTTVYGVLTAPSYSTVYVNGGSSVIGSCIPNSTPANACSADRPVLSWHLNETSYSGSSGEVLDNSGNNLNGTARNGATTEFIDPALPSVDGLGTCRYGIFNRNQGQYLEVADNNLLDMTTAMTIGIWIKPSSYNYLPIISKGSNYQLYMRSDGHLVFSWYGATFVILPPVGYSRSLTSNKVISLNQWTHVTIRYRNGRQSIFINGVEDSFTTYSENLLGGNSTSFRVGNDDGFLFDGLFNSYFDGSLDELRVFNSALTDAQVAALMTQRTECSETLQCFTDDFNRSALGSDWTVNRSSGSFTPSIVNGRLRLTQDSADEATAVSLKRLLPANGNLVIVQFDYYGWSPNAGDGADGMAAIFSDATITPQAGAYGGSLGYAQKTGINGFAGGWLGVGFDEFGNYAAASEGRVGGSSFSPDAVSLRGSGSGTSGYAYLTGTTANLNPGIDFRPSSAPAPGHRYRITLDSTSGNSAKVTVERNTGSGFSTLINNYNALAGQGQAAMPANFLFSLTGSTGALSNYHEIDNLQVCAAQIDDVGQQIHHFQLDFASSALTCAAQTVTIKACLDSSCSSLYTGEVTATLTPSSGWSANPVTFSGGSTTVTLNHGAAGTVSLGVAQSTPTTEAFTQTLCSVDGGTPSSSCNMTFADSGFVFDVPDFIANQGATGILLKAVKKDDTSQKCVPDFASTTKTVRFWSNYVDPLRAAKPVLRQVSVNGSSVGNQQSDATGLSLAFNASGEATLNVNYTDAGQMQLYAQYTGTTGSSDEGLVMTGSDTFVSRPVGFCIQTQNTLGECTAGNASCSIYRYAGEAFPLQLTAMAYDSASAQSGYYCGNAITTPSYQQTGISLASTLVAPSGGVAGTLGNSSYDHAMSSSALTTLSQTISEVGVFKFTATPPSYFGSSIGTSTSLAIGKFVPRYISLSNATITEGCSAFTYMGQPFTLSGTLTAINYVGDRTYNYFGDFAKGSLNYQTEFDGSDQSSRLGGSAPALSWSQGQIASFVNNSILINRLSSPDGPFSNVEVGVSYDDGENDANRATTMSDSTMTLTSANLWGSLSSLRYGRALLDDASGPEDEALPLVLHTQYWNGNYFTASNDDSCTVVAQGTSSLTVSVNSSNGDYYSANPQSLANGSGGTAASGVLPYQAIYLGAAGAPAQVTVQAAVADWLKYAWQGTANGDQNPQATGYFGRYHGNDKQIYWQEIWGTNPP
ncbi:DUF6701 domain-containing protein [Gallaecimonas mangrovi]|uniref:DUF6701 domain-containing protein n=1 Tax=Gallaecimonas mangrovi TaxID=2291597 RepID=UPI000E207E8C|nr:DUF6701 domain-containing protein [Gallaecimonas mangrovi]